MDTALILAGGSATRFGRGKALALVDGIPMIRRVGDALAPLAGETIVSVAEEEAEKTFRMLFPSATFVLDRRRGKGPIEGIRRGSERARGVRLLVAPCDSPLLRSELYRLLLASLGTHEAAVPQLAAIDPVRAVYRTSAVQRALKSGEKGVPSPSALVDRLDAVFVQEPRLREVDPRLDSFLDVNREEDLAHVAARLT